MNFLVCSLNICGDSSRCSMFGLSGPNIGRQEEYLHVICHDKVDITPASVCRAL